MAIPIKKVHSGKFPDVLDSIDHAKTNPILITNCSMKVNYNGVIMEEPYSEFKLYKGLLDNNKLKAKIAPMVKRKARAISEILHKTPDLWFLILMANNIPNEMHLTNDEVYYYKNEIIENIIRKIEKKKSVFEKNTASPTKIEDRTLTPLGI